MEDALIAVLETLKYPVIRQGSLAPDDAYPPTFITFWCNAEDEMSAYDNDTALTTNDFSVYVYSDDPTTCYATLAAARAALKAAGWVITTRAYDAASDEITHIGRGFDVTYILTLTEEEENG